jgi:hypothetical protein
VTKRQTKCLETLNKKAELYARIDSDRLCFFYRDAQFNMTTPMKSLLSKVSKHILAMVDLINDNSTDLSLWEDLFIDIPNYMLLLEGLVQDIASKKPSVNIYDAMGKANGPKTSCGGDKC